MANTVTVGFSFSMNMDGTSPSLVVDLASQCLALPYLNRFPVSLQESQFFFEGSPVNPATYTVSLVGTRLVLSFSVIPVSGVYSLAAQLNFDPSS